VRNPKTDLARGAEVKEGSAGESSRSSDSKPYRSGSFHPHPTPPVLIIDAFNVLHAAPTVHPGLRGLTLPALIRLLEHTRWAPGPAVLVCDGSGGRAPVPDQYLRADAPIRVLFAGPGKDADAAIERMVIQAEHHTGNRGARHITVVSSDKAVLASAVGPIGPKARRMTSESFLREVLLDVARAGGGRPHDLPLDAAEVQQWLQRFESQPPTHKPPASTTPATDPLEGIDPADLDMRKWLGEQ
jgi:predicted RNA-binding protein with PIN domain